MTPMEIYEQLHNLDRTLVVDQGKFGLEATAQRAIELAERCARNYRLLRHAGMTSEAEEIRDTSFHYTIKFKEATG